jgi:flagellar M-ring protein FliF
MQEPGAIIGRSAAVLIAKGEAPRSPEQIQSIHDAVVNAIGARFDQVDLDTHVTVHEVDFLPAFVGPGGETLNEFQRILDTYGPHLKNLLGVVLALVIFMVFLRMIKKFKPNEAEVQILGEDESQYLSGTKALGGGLTPELLNDLIQEKPDNVSVALRKYLDTGSK